MEIGYGTYLSASREGAPEFFEEVRLVEDAGFDAIFYSEHHGMKGYPPSPLTLASMALAHSTRLRAGPMPLLLPLHDAVRVAEEAALVDYLSGGRLLVGASAGYHKEDFGQIGVDLSERAGRMEEGISILRSLWSEHPERYHGQFFTLGNDRPLVHRSPRPQGPPIWLGTGSRAGTRRAARLADGIVLSSVLTFDALHDEVERYYKACRDVGRSVGTVAAIRRACIGGRAEVDKFMETMLAELTRHSNMAGADGPVSARTLAEEEIRASSVLRRCFVGDEHDVTGQIEEFQHSIRVDYLIVKLQWTSVNFQVLRQQIPRWRGCLAAIAAKDEHTNGK